MMYFYSKPNYRKKESDVKSVQTYFTITKLFLGTL